MKRIALFLKWMIIIFSLRLLYLVARQVWNVVSGFDSRTIEKHVFFGIKIPEEMSYSSYIVVSLLSSALLFYVLYLLNIFRLFAKSLVENQIFTRKNKKQLVKIGKGLVVFGIVLVLLQIYLSMASLFEGLDKNNILYSSGYTIGYIIGFFFKFLLSTGFPIFISGLFIFIIANLTEEGSLLKLENDLTI